LPQKQILNRNSSFAPKNTIFEQVERAEDGLKQSPANMLAAEK